MFDVPECPKCGSSKKVIERLRRQDFICKKCGTVIPKDNVVKLSTCPKCNSTNVHQRINKQDFICIKCKNVFKGNEGEKAVESISN